MKTRINKQNSARAPRARARRAAPLRTEGIDLVELKERALQQRQSTWLQSNIARFNRMFAAQQQEESFGFYIFSELAIAITAAQARLFVCDGKDKNGTVRIAASHGYGTGGELRISKADEQAVARCLADRQIVVVPGKRNGGHCIWWPIFDGAAAVAAAEFVCSGAVTDAHQQLLEHTASRMPAVLTGMDSHARTQRLLRQSDSLTRELQNQQVWLKHTNDELEEKARLLAVQKIEMENRNREIEQARQALQEKATQLAVTSKYKSEFLANMSHELRTPLNSMLLLARQLMDNREQTLTPKQLEFSRVIHAAGQELLHLVNDILDLAKVEAGKINIEIGDYTPSELPEFVERNFQLLAQSKNLKLAVELNGDLPATMQTDARRLEQILKNLMSNALKFTKSGGVTLRVRRVGSGWSEENRVLNHAKGVIAFSVEDTGIGIPAEKQKLIFEAFQQADGSTSREYGGTGLGLTISRELAALLGGEIHLQSAPGKGSTFTLFAPETTPAPVADEPKKHQSAPRTAPGPLFPTDVALIGALRGRTALIVDDDIRNIFALTSLLERFQMKVLSAEDGHAALDALNGTAVDVVLMDIMMPGLDGFATIEKLRQRPGLKDLPIIAVTAKAMKNDREKCLRAGAIDYVAKPLDVEYLLNTLKECLQARAVQSGFDEKRSAAAQYPKATSRRPALNGHSK